MKFLDSSIWLDHLGNTNKESSKIALSEDLLFCSILTLFEVKKKLIKLDLSEGKVSNSLEFIKNRAIIVNLDEEIVNSAVDISIKYKLAAIDSLIYSSALSVNAKLITADNDFSKLENVEVIKK